MDASTFIKDFQNLYLKNPQISHWTRQSENCNYGDIIVVSRNSYLCFNSSNLENCYYCYDCRKSKFCGDCTFCENSELIYNCLDCTRCYNSNYLQDCQQCTDCEFCYYCIGCNDCFGCAGLRRKQHHIFNKPYSKESFAEKLKEIKSWPKEKILEEFNKIQLKTPRVFMHQVDNENSFGDYLLHSKNCYWCFDSYLCEDSMYIFNANLERGTKDCIDCGPVANTLERCYDISHCGYIFDCKHIYWCDRLHNCDWVANSWDLNHCFGCIYQKNKEYLFLNKPISKEEYGKITSRMNKELVNIGVRDLYGLINFRH